MVQKLNRNEADVSLLTELLQTKNTAVTAVLEGLIGQMNEQKSMFTDQMKNLESQHQIEMLKLGQ
jgi:hypothetical protein